MSQLEPDGDTDEHADPGLLGNQCADRLSPLHLVEQATGTVHLCIMCLAEPATIGERLCQYQLKRGGSMRDDILGMRQAARTDQRRESRVDLLCGI